MLTRLLPVLGHPLFARYMAGNAASLLGLWVQRVGLGWLTWELTQSPFWLGAVAFADLFPALMLGPFAGVWADRVNRVRLLLYCQCLSALLACALFVLALFGLVNVYLLALLALALGSTASVAQPARLALVPMLVPAQDMGPAVALGSVAFNTARFVGPMIAGVIILFGDVSFTFLFNAATFAFMALMLSTLPAGSHSEANSDTGSVLAALSAGLQYTIGHREIRIYMLVIAVAAIFGKPVAELLPGFAGDVFDRGAVGLALMTQAMGIGALTGGILLTRVDGLRTLVSLTGATLALAGTLAIAFGNTHAFYVGLSVLFAFSMALSATGITTQTIIQRSVEERFRGRVMSLWGLIFRGAPALGVLAMGAVSEVTSLGFVVACGGVLMLVSAVVYLLISPARETSPKPAA